MSEKLHAENQSFMNSRIHEFKTTGIHEIIPGTFLAFNQALTQYNYPYLKT